MRKLLLSLILVLAFSIRIFHVSTNPPSLYWDEAALGYNAFSLTQTGADEYGHKYPFFFESFQDYKLPGYIYTLVPFIQFFGLNEKTVRLPSILFGTGTVFFLFLLTRKLFNSKVALLTAFSLAISPWHIQFTRAGFEVSGGLLFLILGIFLLYKGLKNATSLFLGYLSLVLSICFYNGLRIISPLIFLFFLVAYWNELRVSGKKIIIFLITSALVVLPVVIQFISASALVRFSYTSIFSNPTTHGFQKYFIFGRIFIRNYFSYFSPSFFLQGDGNTRHAVTGVGLLYMWQLIFLVLGIIILLRKHFTNSKIIFLLLLISPIAAAATLPSPHALRSISMLPAIALISTVGIYSFITASQKINMLIPLALIFSIAVALNFSYYLKKYHTYYPSVSARDWAYGYKQVFDYVENNNAKYDNIFITGKYWRPYIFALYYLQYPPSKYQLQPSHNQIDNIYFGYPGYDSSDPYYNYQQMKNIPQLLKSKPHNLFIVAPGENDAFGTAFKTISDLEGKPMFLFIET